MTEAEFLDAWLGQHRRLIEALPGLRRVELLPVAEPGADGPSGVGLLYFETGRALTAALESEAARELRRHTGTFSRSEDAIRMLVHAS
ncbi:MAG: Methylmuconolactone methyl-isomerase [Acidimicrobiaceae bacterium]|nr:Methylmuconolactone methyl-isomerase [Acidimicrobiaceae bacterium]